jgi:hypothetical protein
MSCAWESVFVFPPVLPPPSDSVSASVTAEGAVLFNINNNNNNNTTQMAFYMPSGESVRFCAHAAMGGAYSYLTSLQQQEEEEGQPRASPLTTITAAIPLIPTIIPYDPSIQQQPPRPIILYLQSKINRMTRTILLLLIYR